MAGSISRRAIAGDRAGRVELKQANQVGQRLFGPVFMFSLFTNLLMLTGPVFMLQVYDRVLGSRSVETLVALFALVAFFYAAMGLLDFARSRVLARVGARFQATVDRRVFNAALTATQRGLGTEQAAAGVHDVEAVQKALSSPAMLAVFDIPWTPVFLLGIALFHPWLGALAIASGAVLVAITIANQALSRGPAATANRDTLAANRMADTTRQNADQIGSLGMQEAMLARWQVLRRAALRAQLAVSDRIGGFSSFSRTFRLLVQSAMLALGAYLVLQDQMTPGAMIASSILLGRALAPVEQGIAQWPLVQRAWQGWHNLAALLSVVPALVARTKLPRPEARLGAEQLTVGPPGADVAALRQVSFAVAPGQALGVIGPSGAGKSTLARAITGIWPIRTGALRLGGAAVEQYDAESLGQHIGYLPQKIILFNGTIAENIARMATNPDGDAVVSAAQRAGAHEVIVALPDGYDTQVTDGEAHLSGGQIQRVGLARALYGTPVLLVLDEPNSNLDNTGTAALNTAIRELKAAGGAVIIMAHRPAAIAECDLLLVLDHGRARAFGPRDQVLQKHVANAAQVARNFGD